MKKSLIVKSILVSAFLMASIGGAATAATTTGVDSKSSVEVTAMSKRHVTYSKFFLDNDTIPGTILRTVQDSRGTWAGVLDRDSIEKVDNGYIAYYSGYIYLEN